MAIQKKHGKGRLDKWYKLAKEKGYRARAAFKLIQLNKKYGFLEKSKVLIDLCAAPGSWCQVAAETMPVNSLIIGVDLAPIKPIPRAITFQGDITTEKCRATIRQHLKTWKADTVLHDGAPNVGTAWNQDSFNQAELVLQSMKLATEFLVEGGTFVTKVFRSKDYNPSSGSSTSSSPRSRPQSPLVAKCVGRNLRCLPRLQGSQAHRSPFPRSPLRLRGVVQPTPNNEAKVYNPEVKKRKREGYEEGDYTQFKEVTASEFIQTTDPLAILANCNKLSFAQPANGDVALAALDKLPETTQDIRNCCEDLKVLGRKEFKMLLKWRLRVREIFGFATKKAEDAADEVAEVEPMDEELKIQEELQALKDKESGKRKRERRKENERKQKEIVRMQMNMMAPMDIGMEQDGPLGGDGSMFRLKTIDEETEALRHIARGKMATITKTDKKPVVDDESSGEEDETEDRLELELDSLYDQYRERKADVDPKFRAKRSREEHDDEWEGLSAAGSASDISDDSELEEDSEDEGADDDSNRIKKSLLTDLDNEPVDSALSKRARNFNQDIFKDVLGDVLGDEDVAMADAPQEKKQEKKKDKKKKAEAATKEKAKAAEYNSDSENSEEEDTFEVVKKTEEDDWEDEDRRRSDGKIDIDIVTAEAMTLAHELATGKKTKSDMVDEGFNKWAFRDRDGLPDWFLDDETRHDKPLKPITKAAATAIQQKLRALNARPIKKVQEAKARKKFKAAQKLEKLKRKSELLNEDEGMTEREKADSISKLMAKANQKKPRKPIKVVVAKNTNRGIQGRPKGVKGRYRMVDPRMKKELRAQKRIAKRK
ncbi:unnamed protein product [Parascedosporium putredinis]|uniref:AdoMet-dependent rRNA methyltransferase SPB1 n=1 Tax=Parascedosporium putredinis TaxID=1442378 RepID=A0A9P1GTT0_9PEZI|nr:unnamed protein product [Parascedosporium putredinis]CAI7987502.1 unnamed protein product [Parascedosporium putredinis]